MNHVIFKLLQTVVATTHENIQNKLHLTFTKWNLNTSECSTFLYEIAIHENDPNYINVFLIPDPDCNDNIRLGYKIGGLKLDTGQVYFRDVPFGVDTYEKSKIIASLLL